MNEQIRQLKSVTPGLACVWRRRRRSTCSPVRGRDPSLPRRMARLIRRQCGRKPRSSGRTSASSSARAAAAIRQCGEEWDAIAAPYAARAWPISSSPTGAWSCSRGARAQGCDAGSNSAMCTTPKRSGSGLRRRASTPCWGLPRPAATPTPRQARQTGILERVPAHHSTFHGRCGRYACSTPWCGWAATTMSAWGDSTGVTICADLPAGRLDMDGAAIYCEFFISSTATATSIPACSRATTARRSRWAA